MQPFIGLHILWLQYSFKTGILYDIHLNPLQPSKSRKAIPCKIYNIGNLIYEVLNLPYSITIPTAGKFTSC